MIEVTIIYVCTVRSLSDKWYRFLWVKVFYYLIEVARTEENLIKFSGYLYKNKI